MPDPGVHPVGSVSNADACLIRVGVDHGHVTVWTSFLGARLDAGQREDFQRLFMAAEREAEAWAASYG